MTSTTDRDDRVRRLIVAHVEGDIDYLVGALKDPDLRHTAARYLDDFAGEPEVLSKALPSLLRLLDAADPHVRTRAIPWSARRTRSCATAARATRPDVDCSIRESSIITVPPETSIIPFDAESPLPP